MSREGSTAALHRLEYERGRSERPVPASLVHPTSALYGREQDVRQLDKAELATLIDELRLPEPIYQLWKRYLSRTGYYANSYTNR